MYELFTSHSKECVFTPLAFQAERVLWLIKSVRMSIVSSVLLSLRVFCLSVCLPVCPSVREFLGFN